MKSGDVGFVLEARALVQEVFDHARGSYRPRGRAPPYGLVRWRNSATDPSGRAVSSSNTHASRALRAARVVRPHPDMSPRPKETILSR